MYRILLLTEETLTAHDVTRVAQLHGTEDVTVHVLVPVDTSHNRLVEALDEALLGRLREAAAASGETPPADAELAARHALEESVAGLTAVGLRASGGLTPADPVRAALRTAAEQQVDEILVVTSPHLLEEALGRDWASRLRAEAGLPVLHAVAGTDRVVS